MPTIRELREQAARITTEARAKFDAITPETTPDAAAEIESKFDEMMAEVAAIEQRAARLQALEEAEHRMQEIAQARPTPDDAEQRGQAQAETISYRAAFQEMLRVGGERAELSPEIRAVLRGGIVDAREFRVQSAGTAAAGGYTVPTELAGFIVQSMAAWGPMYDAAVGTEILTASGAPITIPTIDDTAITAVAHTEGAALADTGAKDVTVGQKTLSAYVYDTEFVKWSMELSQDSAFSWEPLLGGLLGERLGRQANLALTTGTGTNQPTGIVTASGLGKTLASSSAITADEVMDFFHSIDPAYRASPKTRVMFNDSTLLALRKLKDGQGNYLIRQAPDGSGRLAIGAIAVPYSINQAMDGLGLSKKIMVFGDFGKYFIRKVGAPVIGVVRERLWPDLGIAGVIRLDGQLGDAAAVKHMITPAV